MEWNFVVDFANIVVSDLIESSRDSLGKGFNSAKEALGGAVDGVKDAGKGLIDSGKDALDKLNPFK